MKALRTLRPLLLAYRWHFGIGILLVFAANYFAVEVPVQVGRAVDVVEGGRYTREALAWLTVNILTLAGLGACFRFLMRRVIIDASRELEFDMRNLYFARLQALDPAFYDARNTGDLMSRGTNDMDAVRMFLGPSLMYMANTLLAVPLILAQMTRQDWRLALLSLLPVALLPPLVRRLGNETHRRSREQQDEFGALTTFAQENLAGIQVVKAYGQERAQSAGFLARNEAYRDKSLRLALVQAFFFTSIRFIAGLGLLVILVVGGRSVMAGTLPVGTLVSFILLFGMIIWPLIALGWVVNLAQRGLASLERINEVLEAVPAVAVPAAPVAPPERPGISIRGLTFRYEGTSEPQLRDIELEVPFGTTVGIIGPVGSGKSTLVNLLARLYPVERGKVLLGGVDINDIDPEQLRRHLSFVFQESFLFSDTIEWNIRFGGEDGLGPGPVRESARRAQLAAEVDGFPAGYDTELGERGINLSGGQRQRLSIARALARDAKILVLDDALSAVDTHTEERILEGLREVMDGRTVFLISHRVSTVAMADLVLVVEDGRITQRGTHAELASAPGLYARLCERQRLERDVESFDELAGQGAPA
ncbi:MAG: ABC transporter ATP-binding protein [Candidatus Sumerlaeia bacterium]|nr:ABC transporter ATP-binding protein [Candidatus Sumerlaeia bacterium]